MYTDKDELLVSVVSLALGYHPFHGTNSTPAETQRTPWNHTHRVTHNAIYLQLEVKHSSMDTKTKSTLSMFMEWGAVVCQPRSDELSRGMQGKWWCFWGGK